MEMEGERRTRRGGGGGVRGENLFRQLDQLMPKFLRWSPDGVV